jgi:flagellum-specific peptidoglycan hydrolase FlgJ
MLLLKRILFRKLLVLVLLGVMFSANAQNKTYIANHKIIATLLGESYGIPAPLILAVAAIESSGGKGPAAKVLNNHFGIEGENDYVNKKGHSSRYKQYANEWASYLDFCQLLTRKRFYNKLKGNTNTKAWVHAMSLAHYSEVPEEWENKVLSVLATIRMPKSSFIASLK